MDKQVVDIGSAELVHAFTPCRKEQGEGLPPTEPPITRMFTSIDGQWLAAVNCFGDVYIFNLEIQRLETNHNIASGSLSVSLMFCYNSHGSILE